VNSHLLCHLARTGFRVHARSHRGPAMVALASNEAPDGSWTGPPGKCHYPVGHSKGPSMVMVGAELWFGNGFAWGRAWRRMVWW